MSKKFVPGLIFGALIGAGAALLFAPKSGKELREDLSDKSEDLKAIALDYIELLSVKGEELVSATKGSTDSIVEKVKDKKESLTDVLAKKTEALTEVINEKAAALTEAINGKKEALVSEVSEAADTVSE